ncbi:hypothetical protein KR093_000628 [Drosophila rubida]|uniref:Cytochrome b-c1 complex subunit 7 n=1 Tax=Drosophila rubida TaxID=30044 RepID=A0AAD4PQ52_9MUSC|nr:hypothetical protein KR093_000628 [Drosophila rubida]
MLKLVLWSHWSAVIPKRERESKAERLSSKLQFNLIMASYIARKGPLVFSNLGKWAYNLSGFNQYGLHRDDCLYENEDVTEAVRRLPRKLYDERNYRIMRALHLSMTKTILPKEQWTKYEDDVKYLEPYLKEVVAEREEREDWNKNH